MEEIVIVGAGLVGALLSIYLGRSGYKIVVYDRNPELNESRPASSRSINLTLCERGFQALHRVGMEDAVRAICVPVLGRIMHNPEGLSYQPYGNSQEAIYSVSRDCLNQVLLEEARKCANIEFHFNEECTALDLSSGTVQFRNRISGVESSCQAERIFAADGAFSTLRYLVQRRTRFDYSQVFSTQAYREMAMPAKASGDWPLEPHAIHIWPRKNYMLIGFPNTDRSFTCSLHLPWEGDISHASLRTEADVAKLFAKSFHDAVPLMPNFARDFISHPPNSMNTIRCSPWIFKDRLVLIGDAAHAIYPSYGQGANAGFEDCRILFESLERHGHLWPAALREYQTLRKPNADAIADLSERHFIELRDLVGDPRFLLRKEIERRINKLYPDRFRDLYSMVTFTAVPYVDALRLHEKQRIVVDQILEIDDCERKLHSGEVDGLIHELMNREAFTVAVHDRNGPVEALR
jgi:kynurenine 3-monooxygenase